MDIADSAKASLCMVALVALVLFMGWAEGREIDSFRSRCMATGDSAAKCELLVELKRSADTAQMMAAASMAMNNGSK